MNPIDHWLQLLDVANKAEREARKAQDYAEAYTKLPENIRPARPTDIVEGAIIWYPKDADKYSDGTYWQLVDDVLYPSDEFKAYCAYSGCRYGLDGAYVEDNDE